MGILGCCSLLSHMLHLLVFKWTVKIRTYPHIWQAAKQIPAGGVMEGLQGYTVLKLIGLEGYRKFILAGKQSILWVWASVLERLWSDMIIIPSFLFSMATHLQTHLLTNQQCRASIIVSVDIKLINKEEAIVLIVLHNYHHTSKL